MRLRGLGRQALCEATQFLRHAIFIIPLKLFGYASCLFLAVYSCIPASLIALIPCGSGFADIPQ